MRTLLATINYDHPQVGQRHAFSKVFGGENVRECDYLTLGKRGKDPNTELLRIASEWKPDWLWMQLQDTEGIGAHAIQKVRAACPRCVVTHWTGDLRPKISPYLSSICKATHATFCSSTGQIPMFQGVGAPHVEYLQIGLDWTEDVAAPQRPPPFPVPDVVFCGGYYGKVFPGTELRARSIRVLQQAGIPVGVVGSGWPRGFPVIGKCGVKQQVHVWRAAKVCLNVNNFNDVAGYYSDRQLIAMASGNPTVCAYIPGLEAEFENRKHCVWFRNTTELLSEVRGLLADEGLRKRIGEAGRAEVIKNHTWESRIRSVLPTIEKLRAGLVP